MARLQEVYRTTLVPQIQEELGLKNVMEVPKLTKITLNMGLGEAVGDKKIIENAMADLEKITGRKGIVTYARKTIAGFKIRPRNSPAAVRAELGAFAMQQSPLLIERVAIGSATVDAPDGESALGVHSEDAIAGDVGNEDVAVGIDGKSEK